MLVKHRIYAESVGQRSNPEGLKQEFSLFWFFWKTVEYLIF